MSRPPESRFAQPLAALLAAGACALALAGCAGGAKPGASGQADTGPARATTVGQTVPPDDLPSAVGVPPRQRPRGRPVRLLLGRRPAGRPVPRDFLGLSFEASELPRLAAMAGHGDVVELLRALGPGVMRFGGLSVDKEAAWTGPGLPLPSWAHVAITASDLEGIARLARATGWRVLLSVGLGHPSTARAAQEARAAERLLGGALAGVALGNEPDRFVRDELRPPSWAPGPYLRQARAYRTAIAAAAPGVRIVGPDASSGLTPLAWVRAAAKWERLALLTDHYYTSTRCAGFTPTIAELLSPHTRAVDAAMIAELARISRAAGEPLRLDETNDISCHGQPGVSDTLASALWTLGYVGGAMSAGLAGVNFHDLIAEPQGYSPLVLQGGAAGAAGELGANPKWYALLLASRLLGRRPVSVHLQPPAEGLRATALRGGRELNLLLVDYEAPGAQPALVRLPAPAGSSTGTILRLTGPSPGARTGILLGGRPVIDGHWNEPARLPAPYRAGGTLEFALPADSAALVTIPLG
jgi:hypothetical protein